MEWEGFWLAVPVTMNLSALVLFALGARAYGPSDFLGLASLRAALSGGPAPAGEPFSSRGILRWVRHPWYTGSFLLLWGHDMDAAGLDREPRPHGLPSPSGHGSRSANSFPQFGGAYREYQREVPMFIPRKPGGEEVRSEE